MKHVIKNTGKVQSFNSKKLVKSIEHTLLSNHYAPDQAKTIAQKVNQGVVEWMTKKTEVTYKDIRAQAAKQLAKIDKNAAFLYKKHKELW